MYDHILFDLDGTLTDSADGIINSITHALDRLGIAYDDRRKFGKYVGPPLLASFVEMTGSEDKAEQGLKFYREYYSTKGLYENRVYDGVKEMLAKLKDAGKKLCVATSKPELFAIKISKHFDLARYFDIIAGATFDSKRVDKADVIAYALENGKIDAARAVMVGDRFHDISGAKKNGLGSIGVLYGYGSREELETAGADSIAKTPEEVADIIINA